MEIDSSLRTQKMYINLDEVKNGKIRIEHEVFTHNQKDYFEVKDFLTILELIKLKLFED